MYKGKELAAAELYRDHDIRAGALRARQAQVSAWIKQNTVDLTGSSSGSDVAARSIGSSGSIAAPDEASANPALRNVTKAQPTLPTNPKTQAVHAPVTVTTPRASAQPRPAVSEASDNTNLPSPDIGTENLKRAASEVKRASAIPLPDTCGSNNGTLTPEAKPQKTDGDVGKVLHPSLQPCKTPQSTVSSTEAMSLGSQVSIFQCHMCTALHMEAVFTSMQHSNHMCVCVCGCVCVPDCRTRRALSTTQASALCLQ